MQTIQLAGPETDLCTAARRADVLSRAMHFRDSSVARTATSIRLSTDCNGIWSRMDLGRDIVDNRLIEDLRGTEPFKWNGGNPTLATECGPRTENIFLAVAELRRSDADGSGAVHPQLAIAAESLACGPNGELTPAQERGRAHLLSNSGQTGAADSRGKPVRVLSQRAKGDEPEIVRRGDRKADGQQRAVGYAATDERRADGAVSARRVGAVAGGDMDGL